MKTRILCTSIASSALWLSATANALTLGHVAPPKLGGCVSCNVFQVHTGAGEPRYRVPAGNWTITSWSAQGGGSDTAQAQLRVYRPTATLGQFKLVKQSKLETIPASGHPSHPTSIKVIGGDLLGLGTTGGASAGYNTLVTSDKLKIAVCHPALGQLVGKGTSCNLVLSTSSLANVSAELVPR